MTPTASAPVDVAAAVQAALKAFDVLGGLTGRDSPTEIYQSARALLHMVATYGTSEELEQAAIDFLDLVDSLREALNGTPFEGLSVAEIKAAKLSSDAEKVKTLRKENRRLEAALKTEQERSRDAILLADEHDRLKRLEKETLDTAFNELAAVSRTICTSIENAQRRQVLEQRLANDHKERSEHLAKEILRAQQLTKHIDNAILNTRPEPIVIQVPAPTIVDPVSTPTDVVAEVPRPVSANSAHCQATLQHEDIEGRLNEIENALQNIRDRQTDLIGRREGIREALRDFSEARRFDALDKSQEQEIVELEREERRIDGYLRRLIEHYSTLERWQQELERYHRAMATIRTGVSEDVLSAVLPTLPEMEDGENKLDAVPVQEAAADVVTQKQAKLATVAERNKLPGKAVFIVTLFELLPDRRLKPTSVRPHRGLINILGAALESGLMANFGWSDYKQLLEKWYGTDEDRERVRNFIKEAGTVGGGNGGRGGKCYRRTSQPLAWDPEELFTETEIKAFRAQEDERYNKQRHVNVA